MRTTILVIIYVIIGIITLLNSRAGKEVLYPKHNNLTHKIGLFAGVMAILIFYPILIVAAKLKAYYDVFIKGE